MLNCFLLKLKSQTREKRSNHGATSTHASGKVNGTYEPGLRLNDKTDQKISGVRYPPAAQEHFSEFT